MLESGWVIMRETSRLYVRLRDRTDPCGVYVRTPERATIFETARAARWYCEKGDVVRPAAQAFALPGALDYVRVPPSPEVQRAVTA